ncbi:MAG: hypothetical protein SFW66_06805 [Gammaproteobacteria bacterium]|nr:hypothetical protein [Gammaproteobacteria bacterium]
MADNFEVRDIDIWHLQKQCASVKIMNIFGVGASQASEKTTLPSANPHCRTTIQGDWWTISPTDLYSNTRNFTHFHQEIDSALQKAKEKGINVIEVYGFPPLVDYTAYKAKEMGIKVLGYASRPDLEEIFHKVNELTARSEGPAPTPGQSTS